MLVMPPTSPAAIPNIEQGEGETPPAGCYDQRQRRRQTPLSQPWPASAREGRLPRRCGPRSGWPRPPGRGGRAGPGTTRSRRDGQGPGPAIATRLGQRHSPAQCRESCGFPQAPIDGLVHRCPIVPERVPLVSSPTVTFGGAARQRQAQVHENVLDLGVQVHRVHAELAAGARTSCSRRRAPRSGSLVRVDRERARTDAFGDPIARPMSRVQIEPRGRRACRWPGGWPPPRRRTG